MNLFRKLFGQSRAAVDDGLYLFVRCGACGRVLRVRVNKRNDLLPDWDNGGYTLTKEMMDDRCFRLMRAELSFDRAYNITSEHIEGGEFITQSEYEAALRPKPDVQEEAS